VRVSLFRCVRVCSSTCLWSLPISTAPVGVGHPVVRAAKDDRPILAHAPFVSLLKSLYLSGTPASVPRMFSEMLSPYQVTSYRCQRTKVTHVKVARVPSLSHTEPRICLMPVLGTGAGVCSNFPMQLLSGSRANDTEGLMIAAHLSWEIRLRCYGAVVRMQGQPPWE
jgi:hypothetical protein